MTSPITDAPATAVDDPYVRQHEAELMRRYPEALVWFGDFSGRWWAFVTDAHGTWTTLNAPKPHDLADQLGAMREPTEDSARPVVAPPGDDRTRGTHRANGRHARRPK